MEFKFYEMDPRLTGIRPLYKRNSVGNGLIFEMEWNKKGEGFVSVRKGAFILFLNASIN